MAIITITWTAITPAMLRCLRRTTTATTAAVATLQPTTMRQARVAQTFKNCATSVHTLSYRRSSNGYALHRHTPTIVIRHWLIATMSFRRHDYSCRASTLHRVSSAATRNFHQRECTRHRRTSRHRTIKDRYLRAHPARIRQMITSRAAVVRRSSLAFDWCWRAYRNWWFRRCH